MSGRTRATLRDAGDAFASGRIDKWRFYAIVEPLHAAGRATYAEIADATGIDAAVVRDRCRYMRALARVAIMRQYSLEHSRERARQSRYDDERTLNSADQTTDD